MDKNMNNNYKINDISNQQSATSYKLQAKSYQKGFTLIEILVVVGLLGIIMVTVTNIFFSGLKAKRKTDSINVIKQSGSYAMGVMSKMIKNATEATCSADQKSITITNYDETTTTFWYEGSHGCSSQVESKRIALDSSVDADDTCLTADNLYLSDYSFSCNDDSIGNPPTVTINFTLSNGTLSDIIGYASEHFTTTVSLRNY
jgi:prepilin-type N-terminal cleavage/methylation domain-containing protein